MSMKELVNNKKAGMAPPVPENEAQRCAVLEELCLFGTEPEVAFDTLAAITARTFDAPISIVRYFHAIQQRWQSSNDFCCSLSFPLFSASKFPFLASRNEISSLVGPDCLWFKSHFGMVSDGRGFARKESVCTYVRFFSPPNDNNSSNFIR